MPDETATVASNTPATPKRWLTRRKFLLAMAASGLTGGVASLFLGARWLRVAHTAVPFFPDAGGEALRVLHLSDLHLSETVPVSFLDHAIRIGIQQQPDLICLTGDLITSRIRRRDTFRRALAQLADTAPTFACQGNHDGGAWAGPKGGYGTHETMDGLLAEAGITVLHNTARLLQLRGRDLTLVGLGDLWSREVDPQRAFAETPPPDERPRLVMAHNPDTKDLLGSFPWTLMLCGHTHGGQLDLPLIGTPFAPVRDQRFVAGLHKWKGRWIYTTRGVGNLMGMRFNCRPEVSVLTLT